MSHSRSRLKHQRSRLKKRRKTPQPVPFQSQKALQLFHLYASDANAGLSSTEFINMIDARNWLHKKEYERMFTALCGLSASAGTAAAGDTAATTTRLFLAYEGFELFLRHGIECLDMTLLQMSKRDKMYRNFKILFLKLSEMVRDPKAVTVKLLHQSSARISGWGSIGHTIPNQNQIGA